MLELRDLSFRAGQNEILHDISLTIPERRFVVVTGPNGGGKTTLARVIMGIDPPSGGQILLDGEDITALSVTERAQRGISYGFQQPPRFKGLTVRDLLNIASGSPMSHDAACGYLTKVGLCARDYIDRDVDAGLSGGEVKRIEIATVLARKGRVMIFDEPEAGIDLWSFARLTETFRELHARRDATIIVISHQERIIRLADEIVLIAGGRLAERGSVEELFPKIMAQTVAGCRKLEADGQC